MGVYSEPALKKCDEPLGWLSIPSSNSYRVLKVNKEARHTFQALVLNNRPINMMKTNLNKLIIKVFRCLSPFKIGIHISLEQSVWAELSWNSFGKRIALICFGPNHWGKKNRAKIWILEKVIFFFSAEMLFFGLTLRVTLLKRCILRTLRFKITCF